VPLCDTADYESALQLDSNTVTCYSPFVSIEFTLEELAQAVQDWCEEHRVLPANGQAAEQITERNIRYYRTLGLLDPPLGNYNKTFTNKHRLQLIAIRLYQAQGLPLRKIRDELYGKSLEDLVALEKQVSKRGKQAIAVPGLLQMPLATESWSVVPLTGEFLLVSRQNKQVPRAIIEKLSQLLQSVRPDNENATEPSRN
jgi:DNA-binding transcriptional MerR regulator